MATRIKSIRGLIKAYDSSPAEVQTYFAHIPKLLDYFPMDVCLAYVFARLELGQNMALYCGVVKLHRAHTEVARSAISIQHMTRDGFRDLYTTIFDFKLPTTALADLKTAEETRDQIMHGKKASEDMIRNAIARVIEYAQELNLQLDDKCGFKPFGDLRGVSGRSVKLDKRTTRYMLKGMGFALA